MTNPIVTLSRERLENLASGDAFYCIQDDEGKELARAMLAVMDARQDAIHSSETVLGVFNDEKNEIAVPKGSELSLVNIAHWHAGCTKEVVVRDIATPPSPSVPNGWKLVPVKATAEIIQAGIEAHYYRQVIQQPELEEFVGPMESAYNAMLAAAPGGE